MNTNQLRKFVLVTGLALGLLGGGSLAQAAKPAPVPLGDDGYQLTREATSAFARSTTPLKYEAQADAAEFCMVQGKRMKLVSVAESKGSIVSGRFSKVTIVFKALAPGDPALAGQDNTGPISSNATPEDKSARQLRMLQELHGGGILTDGEFDAAKARVHERAK